MHKLNLLVDNALLQLVEELVEGAKYDEATLVINKLLLPENVKKALDILGARLNVSKLKESAARKCLACLIADKAL